MADLSPVYTTFAAICFVVACIAIFIAIARAILNVLILIGWFGIICAMVNVAGDPYNPTYDIVHGLMNIGKVLAACAVVCIVVLIVLIMIFTAINVAVKTCLASKDEFDPTESGETLSKKTKVDEVASKNSKISRRKIEYARDVAAVVAYLDLMTTRSCWRVDDVIPGFCDGWFTRISGREIRVRIDSAIAHSIKVGFAATTHWLFTNSDSTILLFRNNRRHGFIDVVFSHLRLTHVRSVKVCSESSEQLAAINNAISLVSCA